MREALPPVRYAKDVIGKMKLDVADRATEFRISAASKDGYLAFVYLGFSIRMLINDLS